MTPEATEVTLRIYRGDAEGGQYVEYSIPCDPSMVVLDAVHAVQSTLAPDLAVRWNCKAGKCGSCGAEVDGHPKLMCMERMEKYVHQGELTIHPIKTFPIIKDITADVSWNYEINKMIPPFKPAAGAERNFTQAEADRPQEFRKCIECFMCQTVCHVLRDHNRKDVFCGPRYLVRSAGLEMHPLDTEDRLDLLRGPMGIGYCNITKCCTEVCPEDIHITDNAIIPLKERVADEYYDPLRWLWRKAKAWFSARA